MSQPTWRCNTNVRRHVLESPAGFATADIIKLVSERGIQLRCIIMKVRQSAVLPHTKITSFLEQMYEFFLMSWVYNNIHSVYQFGVMNYIHRSKIGYDLQ